MDAHRNARLTPKGRLEQIELSIHFSYDLK